MRIALGMGAVATASALVTAFLAPGPGPATGEVVATQSLPVTPTPSIRHVVRYVQLQPGQTAPPQAQVQPVPAPTPRVVIVTTHQSGTVR